MNKIIKKKKIIFLDLYYFLELKKNQQHLFVSVLTLLLFS